MSSPQVAFLVTVAAAGIFLGCAQAPARADSAEEGRNIAARWCAGCHDVGVGERRTGHDAAPDFKSVARRPGLNSGQLENWIGHPHPPMPNLNLTDREVDNLVIYIQSLKDAR